MSLREALRSAIQKHAAQFPEMHSPGLVAGSPRTTAPLIDPKALDAAESFDGWYVDPETGYRMRGKA